MPTTPEQALSNFLLDIQRRNWDRAFSSIERTNGSVDEQEFIAGVDGRKWRLAAFSGLECYEARPLHATDSDALMRVRLQWATPVGPG